MMCKFLILGNPCDNYPTIIKLVMHYNTLSLFELNHFSVFTDKCEKNVKF